MSEPSRDDRIREYVIRTREHFSIYHNHKEYMTYLIMTFYFASIGVLIASNDLAWKIANSSVPPISHCTMFYSLSFVSFATIIFVWLQLVLRARAARIVAACDSLRLQWLTESVVCFNASADWHAHIRVPRSLREEIERTQGRNIIFIVIPLILMLGWHGLLMKRLAVAHGVASAFPFACIIGL